MSSSIVKNIMSRILAADALVAALLKEKKEKRAAAKEKEAAAARKAITLHDSVARRSPIIVDMDGARKNLKAPHNQAPLFSKSRKAAKGVA